MGVFWISLGIVALFLLAGSLVVLAVRDRDRRPAFFEGTEDSTGRLAGETSRTLGEGVSARLGGREGASESAGSGEDTQTPTEEVHPVTEEGQARSDETTMRDDDHRGPGIFDLPGSETPERDLTDGRGSPHKPTEDDIGSGSRESRGSRTGEKAGTVPLDINDAEEKPGSSLRIVWVAWYARGSYRIGVEVSPSDEAGVYRVYVGETQLSPARGRPGIHEVTSLVPVTVRYELVDGRLEEMTIEPDRIMLFKITTENVGRFVGRLTNGTYLLLIPKGWSLVPETAGSRAKVGVTDHIGWVLPIEDSSEAVTVRATDGTELALRRDSVFTLSTPDFVSDMDRRGFYLGSAPVVRLRSPCSQRMTVVVGEERAGLRRPRAVTVPPGTREYALDSLLEGLHWGWFFIRVYDSRDTLLESDQFVYLRDVAGIRMSGYQLLPGSSGHLAVAVGISHGSGVTVTTDGVTAYGVSSCAHSQGTSITVPPDPCVDFIDIGIVPLKGDKTTARIGVGRLWFQLGKGGSKADRDAWTDSPMELRLHDFEMSSNRTVFVQVPPRVRPLRLAVGFEGGQPVHLRVSPGEREAMLRLSKLFADVHSRRASNHPMELRLWLDGEPGHCVIGIVDPVIPTEVFTAWGRSKNATARASLRTCGSGQVICDGHRLDRRHPTVEVGCELLQKALSILAENSLPPGTDLLITTKSKGYKTVRRSKATAHAIGRILGKISPWLRARLKREGLGGAPPREALIAIPDESAETNRG